MLNIKKTKKEKVKSRPDSYRELSGENGFAFTIEHIIYASPEKVFGALTNSKKIEQWSGEKSLVELKTGGKFKMFGGWTKGTIVSFTENKTLSFTWKPDGWDKKAKPSLVEIAFIKHKAGTQILIRHSQLPSQLEADSHKEGWINYVMEPMNDFFIEQLETK